MKRALIATFAIFVLVVAGFALLYFLEARNVQANLARAEAAAEKSKLVSVEFIVEPPADTPKDQQLYISGSASSMGNWNADGAALRLQPDGKYHGNLDLLTGVDYAYKVTRGTWSTVETAPNDQELPNRNIKLDEAKPVEIKVASWVDHGKAVPGRQHLAGIIRTHAKVRSDALGNERTLIVYLPPDYDTSKDRRYPVLYMQDGGNLFNESTSYQGIEWGLDEAAEKLIKDGKIEPLIIVGIYSSEQRTPEFTPPPLATNDKPGRGDVFAKSVAEEIVPFINERYRTKTTRADTGIGGGSMGGLISLYIAKTYPEKFGKLALFSPWLQLNGKKLTADWSEDNSWLKGEKIHFEMATKNGALYPSDTAVADAKDFAALLDKAGLKRNADYTYDVLEGQEPNEPAWSKRCEPMLLNLYKK